MDTFLNNLQIFTVIYYIAVKIYPKYFLNMPCSNCMLEVVIDDFVLMIVRHDELISCLVKLRSHYDILLHFFGVQENLFKYFTNNLHW